MSADMTSRMSDLSNMMNPEQADTQAQVVTSIAPAPAPKLTLDAVREKLAGKSGRRYWKNLNELADTPEFNAMMQEEFPRQAMQGEWVDAVSRRGFLKVMGASLALAGLAGCTKQPDEPIYPYIKQPEDLVLGKPMYFATAYPFQTGAIPVANLTAGTSGQFQVPEISPDMGFGEVMPRFYRLNYTVATGPFTAGALTSNLVLNPSQATKIQNYPSNYIA